MPAIYTGFLPYLSPNLVTNAHPMTTPSKKVNPMSPIEMPEAHSKSNYTNKLCKLSEESQSISQ